MIPVLILSLSGWFNWQALKTDDFTVIYKKDYYWEALHALHNLEYYKHDIQNVIGGKQRNLPVVIEDVGAMSNGFANPIFHNVHIFTRAPGFAYRIEGIESWYRVVTVHEYAHIVHMSRSRGAARILSDVFGSIFAPNIYSPGWIIEGITVYSESKNSPYEGRLNDGFFESYIGARVHSGAMPSIIEATNTPVDFPSGAYYLYGGEFFSYLARQYGEEKFAEFFSKYGSYFWAPLSAVFPCTGLDIAARQTFGKSFPALFWEWQHDEKNRYKNWAPQGTRLTDRGWYLYSLEHDNGKIYYVRYEPLEVDGFTQRSLTHIIEFDCEQASEKTIASLNSTLSAPLRIFNGKIYYATYEVSREYANVYYNGFGILANLHERDLLTGADRLLFADEIRGFCVLPDSSILYSKDKVHGYGSELWLFDHDKHTFFCETDLLIGELDANGKYIIAVGRHDYENWNIYLLDRQEQAFIPVVATPWVEGSVDLLDESFLYTANYDGVYGIFWHDILSCTTYRLTNGGYAEHGVLADSLLYFKGMSKTGFDVYRTTFSPEKYDVVQTSTPRKPDFNELELNIQRGGYVEVLKTLIPAVRIPFVLPVASDLSSWAYGLAFLGGDATNENVYGGFVARETSSGDLTLNLLWQSRFFSPLEFSFFYDYKNSFDYTISFPALMSLEYGLSNLTPFLDGRVFDGHSRVEFAPGCFISFQYPRTRISAKIALPFERQAWGSDIHRSAQQMSIVLQQLLAGGELRLLSQAYVDPHNPDIPDFSIRGYDKIAARRAVILTSEYVHRLCKLRIGLWNPNIYLEDLYWAVFADYAVIDEGVDHYSVGCELRLEAKAGFGFLQIVPKIGMAVTKEKDFRIFFGISPFLAI